ncbi:MAG: FAD-dependent oxidoreductase, partial [Sporichthyaceae bacterium]|nr:FAD-dependent oxidoreductase [Sporichthyaceae bacterium]
VAVTVADLDGHWHLRADDAICSMPLQALIAALDPPAPHRVREAAAGLRYRDFLTVALVVPEAAGFPDNWIYVHTPGVRVGRVQNYRSWSADLVKPGWTCLGLEYFVCESDELWSLADDVLVKFATNELEQLDLLAPDSVEAGYVVRMPKAYPVYDQHYKRNVEVIRAWLAQAVPNLHPVGRNGMHRYNNQDHSMLTAMLAVDNVLDGARHDLWAVNVDHDYHEQHTVGDHSGGRAAPTVTLPAVPR